MKERTNDEYDQHQEVKRITHLAKKVAEGDSAWEEAPHPGGGADSKGSVEVCTSVVSKGHCTVYTTDGAWFEVPLACLGTAAFAELLQMSKEEFGFTGGDGRITLPCVAMVMEYALCLLRRGASAELEKAFLNTMTMSCHSTNHMAPYVAACC